MRGRALAQHAGRQPWPPNGPTGAAHPNRLGYAALGEALYQGLRYRNTAYPVVQAGWQYAIIAKHSGQAVDVATRPVSHGVSLRQYLWQYEPFRFQEASNTGLYHVISTSSNMCVDHYGANANPGAAISLWTCNGGASLMWRLEPTPDGTWVIRSADSRLCWDVYGASTANGADIVQFSCNYGANQRWRLQS